MPEAPIAVYQAEWCPYSSQVRQKLTEINMPFVAIPVPADRADRGEMRHRFGTDVIPVVVLEDGTVLDGDAGDIVAELGRRFEDGPYAEGHRRQRAAH